MQFYLQTKPFLNSKLEKRKFVSEKKGQGRHFGPGAEASPAR
jgi:hypothetical protein